MIYIGIILSFLSAFFKSGKSITTKISANSTDEYVTSLFIRFGTFILALLFVLFYSQKIPLNINLYIYALINGILISLSSIFITKGFKLTDVSIAAPLLSFVPISSMIPAIIILNQTPTIISGIGVFLVTLGAYFINIHTISLNILEPIKSIYDDKGSQYVMIGVLFAGCIPTIDKIGISYTTEYIWLVLTGCVSIILLLIITKIKSKNIQNSINENKLILFFVGLFNAGIYILQIKAYNYIDVYYVQAIKRVSILITIGFSYFYFNEKHLKQRVIASIIMILGVLLIVIGL